MKRMLKVLPLQLVSQLLRLQRPSGRPVAGAAGLNLTIEHYNKNFTLESHG
ncbi:hypothetical protein D3C81_2257960 [compost metagenome]